MGGIELGEKQVISLGLVRIGRSGSRGMFDRYPEDHSKIEQRAYVIGSMISNFVYTLLVPRLQTDASPCQFSVSLPRDMCNMEMNHILCVISYKILAPARKLRRVFRNIAVMG